LGRILEKGSIETSVAMNVTLNGKPQEIGDSITILQMLDGLKLHPKQVAVEVNRAIVKRDQFENRQLSEGDEIEILRFVGGGCQRGENYDR
jgi:sulfur carrier protein